MNPPDTIPATDGKKSKWKIFLALGCLSVLVLLGVAHIYFKHAVVEHLERKMADAGFAGKIGEMDYSFFCREISIRNLNAVPIGSRLSELGEMTIAEGTIRFDPDGSREIVEVNVRGIQSGRGSVGALEFRPGNLFSANDVTLKNAAEFGGGDFLKLTELRLEYGITGVDLLKMKVAELTAVKNKNGKWNLLVKPIKELKFMDKKVDRIGEFHLEVESVKVVDLAREGSAQTVPVKKTIRAHNIRNAGDFNRMVLPELRALLGEVKLATEKQP